MDRFGFPVTSTATSTASSSLTISPSSRTASLSPPLLTPHHSGTYTHPHHPHSHTDHSADGTHQLLTQMAHVQLTWACYHLIYPADSGNADAFSCATLTLRDFRSTSLTGFLIEIHTVLADFDSDVASTFANASVIVLLDVSFWRPLNTVMLVVGDDDDWMPSRRYKVDVNRTTIFYAHSFGTLFCLFVSM